jgi:phosphoribosylformylglycinamidine synthase
MAKPRALVLTGYGINCDRETRFAFELAGAEARRVHVNDLIDGLEDLHAYQILAFPGGFSFGDDIASGRVLAAKLATRLGERVNRFVEDGKLVLGICNGFQVLAKYGLVPRLGGGAPAQTVTVTYNDSARFEDRWVHLRTVSDRCVFTRSVERIELPVAHGEGKVVAGEATLDAMERGSHVALRYATPAGEDAAGAYPLNPNGSLRDIAGICDATGRVLGLMPHPERFLDATNHPHWTRRREQVRRRGGVLAQAGDGRVVFDNAVDFFR